LKNKSPHLNETEDVNLAMYILVAVGALASVIALVIILCDCCKKGPVVAKTQFAVATMLTEDQPYRVSKPH